MDSRNGFEPISVVLGGSEKSRLRTVMECECEGQHFPGSSLRPQGAGGTLQSPGWRATSRARASRRTVRAHCPLAAAGQRRLPAAKAAAQGPLLMARAALNLSQKEGAGAPVTGWAAEHGSWCELWRRIARPHIQLYHLLVALGSFSTQSKLSASTIVAASDNSRSPSRGTAPCARAQVRASTLESPERAWAGVWVTAHGRINPGPGSQVRSQQVGWMA